MLEPRKGMGLHINTVNGSEEANIWLFLFCREMEKRYHSLAEVS